MLQPLAGKPAFNEVYENKTLIMKVKYSNSQAWSDKVVIDVLFVLPPSQDHGQLGVSRP